MLACSARSIGQSTNRKPITAHAAVAACLFAILIRLPLLLARGPLAVGSLADWQKCGAGVGCSRRDLEEEVSGCCIKTNLTRASFLSFYLTAIHAPRLFPSSSFLLSVSDCPNLFFFFSHAMIGRRRGRVIKPRSLSVDRQHRFGLKRVQGGGGEAAIITRPCKCPGSRLPPPPPPSPSSSRRPRPPTVSECRSLGAPLAGGDGSGGDSDGVRAAADRMAGVTAVAVAKRRLSLLLLAAAAAVSDAAAVIAATESRFRRRRPPRALEASVCRTGAPFSDLQCRGKHQVAMRRTEDKNGLARCSQCRRRRRRWSVINLCRRRRPQLSASPTRSRSLALPVSLSLPLSLSGGPHSLS